jgi:LacI family transcriptional regulator
MRPSPRKRTVLLALTLTHLGFYRGAIRYAADHGWHLVADAIYTASVPLGWKGDGILSFVGYRQDLANYIKSATIPVVEISSVRRDLGLPCVGEDNEEIGRNAAAHLLERNFKHFAWAPFWEDVVNEERYEGFANLIQCAGFQCERLPPLNTQRSKSRRNQMDWTARRSWLVQKFRSFEYPVGIFCYNDYVAADIIGICLDSHIHVPEQIAVIGVDDDPIVAACVPIPISSVRHDMEGMAYHAAELLDRLMDGEAPSMERVRVRPKGVATRQSTDILAIQNPVVLKGIRFIRENFAQGDLSVERVVAASDVSRRTLEKAFRVELNRSILDEIIRTRISQAKHLLEATDFSVADIAARSGFANLNHFFRVFRRQTLMSPRSYRVERQEK